MSTCFAFEGTQTDVYHMVAPEKVKGTVKLLEIVPDRHTKQLVSGCRSCRGLCLVCRFQVQDGPYEGIIFTDNLKIHGENARRGHTLVRAMLEAGRGARPDKPESYNLQSFEELQGMCFEAWLKLGAGRENGMQANILEQVISPFSTAAFPQ